MGNLQHPTRWFLRMKIILWPHSSSLIVLILSVSPSQSHSWKSYLHLRGHFWNWMTLFFCVSMTYCWPSLVLFSGAHASTICTWVGLPFPQSQRSFFFPQVLLISSSMKFSMLGSLQKHLQMPCPRCPSFKDFCSISFPPHTTWHLLACLCQGNTLLSLLSGNSNIKELASTWAIWQLESMLLDLETLTSHSLTTPHI